MRKSLFLFIIPLAIFSLAIIGVSIVSAQAQAVACPSGYTCTPIAPQPVNCPAGYICTPTTPVPSPVPIPPTPINSCYVWSTNMTIGSTGADVVALQTWLIANGYNIPDISSGRSPKGYFGQSTFSAVKLFQMEHGIPNTGFVGPLTRGALTASCIVAQPSVIITNYGQTTSLTPTISGTASGVSQVGIVLSNDGGKVYGSGLISVVNGGWSITVSPALVVGQYTINVYDANNNKLTSDYLNVS